MLTDKQYKSYVGQYVKRFYAPFKESNICKIKDFRTGDYGAPEYLYNDGTDEWWADCEDSCIITNETPVKNLDWVANVNHREYAGYNPFTRKMIISNILS